MTSRLNSKHTQKKFWFYIVFERIITRYKLHIYLLYKPWHQKHQLCTRDHHGPQSVCKWQPLWYNGDLVPGFLLYILQQELLTETDLLQMSPEKEEKDEGCTHLKNNEGENYQISSAEMSLEGLQMINKTHLWHARNPTYLTAMHASRFYTILQPTIYFGQSCISS